VILAWVTILLARWILHPLSGARKETAPLQYSIADVYVLVAQFGLGGAVFISRSSLVEHEAIVFLAASFVVLGCFWLTGIYDMSRVPVSGWRRILTLGLTYPLVYVGCLAMSFFALLSAFTGQPGILITWLIAFKILFHVGRHLAGFAAGQWGFYEIRKKHR